MLVIASDHGGYNLKEKIKEYLAEKEIDFVDIGTSSDMAVDYPKKAKEACRLITSGECERGILVCGTGIGMSIAANKIHGIRAAVCSDYFSAKYTRKHNDANVLCLGERVLGFGSAIELVNVFLSTEFEGGRHQVRLDQISELEKEN